MIKVKETIEKFMGKKIKDTVTGQTGIVTAVTFDLYGCVQCLVTPNVNRENTRVDSHWYDISRLEITSRTPVMNLPEFDYDKGPAKKPIF